MALASEILRSTIRIKNLRRIQAIQTHLQSPTLRHRHPLNSPYLQSDPVGPASSPARKSVPSTPAGRNYTFTYNASGELLTVKLPRNGELRYTHQTTNFANSVSARELQNRRLVKQAGASEVTYNLIRDPSDASQVMHSSLALTDPSGVGRKCWLFSSANDYTRGFLTQ